VDGVFAPFALDGFGQYVVLPDRIELAMREGRPDLVLELRRGPDPSRPPEPYAQLEARIACVYPLDAALALVRAQVRGGAPTVRTARARGGRMRMVAMPGGTELPAELGAAIAIAGDDVDHVWLRQRLSADAGAVLHEALVRGTLLVDAQVELDVPGVSPRVDAAASFDPRALLEALHEIGAAITREQIAEHVARHADTLFSRKPDPVARGIDALVDRITARFGTATMGTQASTLQLAHLDDVQPGRFTWDLAQPFETTRVIARRLDAFAAASQLARDGRIAEIVKRVKLPDLPTGTTVVEIDLELPPHVEGLDAVTVTLEAPPAPPRRRHAALATVDLSTKRSATATLTLGMGEPPSYAYTVEAIVRGGSMRGTPTPHHGAHLFLTRGALPLVLVPIAADPALLAEGDVEVVLRHSVAAATPITGRLDTAHPTVTFALLPEQVDATLEVTLVNGDARCTLPVMPAGAVRLGLQSFPEYGAHEVQVEARFGADKRPVLVELVAETGAPSDQQTLLLTPEAPRQPFAYLATSVLRPGFRWRFRRAAGAGNDSPWATGRPFAPLVIELESEEVGRGGDHV
jgi:hypothetical protein